MYSSKREQLHLQGHPGMWWGALQRKVIWWPHHALLYYDDKWWEPADAAAKKFIDDRNAAPPAAPPKPKYTYPSHHVPAAKYDTKPARKPKRRKGDASSRSQWYAPNPKSKPKSVPKPVPKPKPKPKPAVVGTPTLPVWVSPQSEVIWAQGIFDTARIPRDPPNLQGSDHPTTQLNRKLYLRLILKYHPDKHHGEEQQAVATEDFKIVNQANSILLEHKLVGGGRRTRRRRSRGRKKTKRRRHRRKTKRRRKHRRRRRHKSKKR